MKTMKRSATWTRTGRSGLARRLRIGPGLILLGAVALPAAPLAAQDSPSKGLEIAREADRREDGFGDWLADLKMVLRNRHGEESVREMSIRTLEVADDGDKSLVVFDRPRDVEGTALLSYTHKQDSDDQWLYLPALKRVKRIASDNKAGPFMGSEFAYEDIASQEVEKYTYRFLREEHLGGVAAFVIERVPVDPKSGYSRQTVWYDTDEYRPLRVDYFDRKGDALKTLTFTGYERYAGHYWKATRMEMENHQTGKGTTLLWKGYEFGSGLSERDFDQNALRRAR
jgi:hypothetical protein